MPRGQMINGNLGDKFGGRRMMFLGAVSSFALNWLTSFALGFRIAGRRLGSERARAKHGLGARQPARLQLVWRA